MVIGYFDDILSKMEKIDKRHKMGESVSYDNLNATEMLAYTIQITNVGMMDSDCTVLGFIQSDHSDAPLNKLFDFDRVFVKQGQSVNATLTMSPYV